MNKQTLSITYVPLNELKPAPYNPRRASKTEFAALKRSLKKFGWAEPIVVNKRSGFIVGGHMRMLAAVELGMTDAPVVYVDLDEKAEKSLNIALNKISGEFDEDMLSELLMELDGEMLELTGFTEDELHDLNADPFDEEPDPKESKEPKAKSYTTAELREKALSYHPLNADVIVEFCDWIDKKAGS